MALERDREIKGKRKKNRYLWLVVLSGIWACTLPVSRGSTARKGQECGKKTITIQEKEVMITLTKENDGGEYQFRPGQIFQVVLPENPTTGYRWTVAEPAPSNITLIRQEYTAKHHDPLIVGAGGVRTMTFQAGSEGSTHLVLLLRRAWEAEGEHVDSFNLSLHIAE